MYLRNSKINIDFNVILKLIGIFKVRGKKKKNPCKKNIGNEGFRVFANFSSLIWLYFKYYS